MPVTEGRSTGVPTIQAKLADYGSPRAIFETTDERLTFLVTISVHEECDQSSEKYDYSSERGSGTAPKSSGTKKKKSDAIIGLIKADPQITAPKCNGLGYLNPWS